MTALARDDRDAPFNDWIRNHPGLDSVRESLSVQNNDLWVHRYSARNERKRITVGQIVEHLQLVEVKAFGAGKPFAQQDTHDVIDKLIRRCTTKNNRRRPVKIADSRRPGCTRSVRWLGIHLLQMSADRPDTSGEMVWDGKYWITEGELVELLRFDRDPDSPMKFLDTRRHHKRPDRETHPDLFVVTA